MDHVRMIGAAAGAVLLALWVAPPLAQGQDLREITFVQPSPSAINSFPIYVALGEGYFVTQLQTYRDQHGETVAEMRFRLLKFKPPAR